MSILRFALFLALGPFLAAHADITVRGKTLDASTSDLLAGLVVSAEHLHSRRSSSDEPFSASTTTLDDGSFVLELPDADKDYNILIRDREGVLLDGFTHIDEDTDLGTLKLSLAGACSGLIRAEGHALPGVDVVAEFRMRKTSCKHYTEAARVTTDADGAFEFSTLAPGMYRCFVDDERFAPQRQEIEIQDDFAYLELAVEPGCTIKGTVRTTDGRPAEGVTLNVGGPHSREAKTDANGFYSISGLEKKGANLSIASDDYAFAADSKTRVEFENSTAVVRDVVIVPAATLQMMLVPEDGVSLPDSVFVQLRGIGGWRDSRSMHPKVVENVVSCKGLRPGTYSLHAHADGVWHDATGLNLIAGQVLTLQVAVIQTVDLSGTTMDAGGAPVAGVSLRLSGKVTGKRSSGGSYSSSFQMKSAKSDGDGVFVLCGVTPGTYELEGKHENYVEAELDLTVTAEADQDAHLVLEKACVVDGVITAADETRVEGAKVTVIKVEVEQSESGRSSTSRHHLARGETDDEGRFAIGGVPAGSHELKVEHDDYRPHTQEITVAPGTNSLPQISLVPGFAISGTVVASDGSTVEDIRVMVNGPEGATGSGRVWRHDAADEDGAFEIGGLAEGRYSVTIRKDNDTVSSLQDIVAGTDDLFVSLGAEESVTGRVVTAGGSALAGVVISTQRKEPGDGSHRWGGRGDGKIQTDDEGEFTVQLREGSEYTITARLSPYLPGSASVDLGQPDRASPAPVEITMIMGNTVRGIVVHEADGLPATDIGFTVGYGGRFDGSRYMRDDDDALTTDDEGRFELKGVAGGVVELLAYSYDEDSRQHQVLARKYIMVEDSLVEDVRIELPAVGSIKGVCKDADGTLLTEVLVTLQAPGQPHMMRQAKTDAAGVFEFEKLPAGTYQLHAVPSDGDDSHDVSRVMSRLIVALAVVKAGETTELELRRKPMGEDASSLTGSVSVNGTVLTSGTIYFRSVVEAGQQNEQMAMQMFGWTQQAEIRSNGTFEVRGLEVGDFSYKVSTASEDAEDDDVICASSYNGNITIADGVSSLAIEVTGVTLSGLVSAASGPQGQIILQLVPDAAGMMMSHMMTRRTITGDDGHYEFDGLQPGVYKLHTQSEEFGSVVESVEITEKDATLDVALTVGVTLKGRITATGDEAIRQAVVMVLSEDGQDAMGCGFSGSDGEYTITSPLPKGAFLLLAFRDGYAIATSHLTLTKDTTWDVELQPGGSAEITVVDMAGAPAVGQQLEVRDSDNALVERCRDAVWASVPFWSAVYCAPLDSEGKTTMKGLAPGTYTVSVEGGKTTATFSITALETTTVRLTL